MDYICQGSCFVSSETWRTGVREKNGIPDCPLANVLDRRLGLADTQHPPTGLIMTPPAADEKASQPTFFPRGDTKLPILPSALAMAVLQLAGARGNRLANTEVRILEDQIEEVTMCSLRIILLRVLVPVLWILPMTRGGPQRLLESIPHPQRMLDSPKNKMALRARPKL